MDHAYSEPFDVCVVGSGPAGIIFALEHARLNPHKRIALVEFGKKDQGVKNSLDDSIQIPEPLNHHDPYECTNKGLGGSSATWGGRCVMYDQIDFVDRPVIANGCTWRPDLLQDINKYTSIAASYFECGSPEFDLKHIPEFKDSHISENFVAGNVTDSVVERWSMPTRFGPRYEQVLRANKNITVFEGAEARDFGNTDTTGIVNSLEVRFGENSKRVIHAKSFVLAAGTQETTRILLRNPQLFKNIGGRPDALGKYYQGHLSGKIASVKFTGDPKKTDYGFLRDKDGIYLRRRLQFTTKFLADNNLLNTAIWLDNPMYFDPGHGSGAMSFMYLAMITPVLGKRLAPPAIAHSITKGKVNKLPQHFGNILRGLPGSLTIPAEIFFKRYCLKRKLPGVFLYSPENRYALHFHSEQIPYAGNRMELGPDGESLVIHYKLLDADIESVVRLHEVLDESLRTSKAGELQYWFKKDEMIDAIRKMSRDGIHQSGTTRIADTPKDGVVDHDLKLWGTGNVFICSSSVFPTSGQANPTFMIGAFAARLASHLTKVHENNSIS